MRKIIYPDSLKKKAGELFALRDAFGKRIYTGKKLASELGVPRDVAYYLEYEGRQLLGVLPPKRAYKSRRSAPHVKREKPLFSAVITPQKTASEEVVEQFVEENVYPAEEETQKRSSLAVIIYAVIMTAIVCFVAGTYIINWLVNTLA